MNLIKNINALVWGPPTLILILAVGIWLTFRTGAVQLTLFPRAWKRFWGMLKGDRHGSGGSSYRSLCTALGATVGTGNLAGVAGAIALGGPGAIFWMWICGILGMVTKFAEAVLAVRYRERLQGEYQGGPMYMIRKGLGKNWHWLAGLYCFFGVIAAFGVGNATQINALIGSAESVAAQFGGHLKITGKLTVGALLAILVGVLLLGGASRIGKAAEQLVPFASVCYLLMGLAVLILRWDRIGGAFSQILQGAISPKAVTGGAVGSAFLALRIGTSRGVFTNEAGMGTAAIAHGGAHVKEPCDQGLMGIIEVFLDTIVICTMTALVILCSGIPIPYGIDTGVQLTQQAFAGVLGDWTGIVIALALCCFALATVLGWGLYGARCAQYLLGEKAWKPFVLLQMVTIVIGAVLGTGTVWLLAETVNGLMAIPNLTALILLSPEVIRLTKQYKSLLPREKVARRKP